MDRRGAWRTWLSVVPAMLVPVGGALLYFVFLREHAAARAAYGATKLFTLVWPLAAVWLVLRERLPALELGHRRHRRALPLGLAAGAAVVLLMLGLMQTPFGDVARAHSGAIRAKAEGLGVLRHYWLFTGFLCVFHSLLEEYYWRWFVFGRLRRVVGVRAAHLLAGAAFAAHHIVVLSQFFPMGWGVALGGLVGVGGILWSVLYARQRTLAGAWISHLLVDLGIMIIGHRLLTTTVY